MLGVYPLNFDHGLYLLSLALLLASLNVILLSLVCFKHSIKPVLIGLLLVSSFAAYYMDSYHVIIDDVMIDNIVKTDVAEFTDLLSLKQLLYFLVLGVLPSIIVYRLDIIDTSIKASLISRIKLTGLALIIFTSTILISSDFYASFFREHKSLRFYANPSYYLYSSGKYIAQQFNNGSTALKLIGLDAKIPASDADRELIILVVGETARADRFSLNGYSRNTNPLLQRAGVISFKDVSACGTSTAVSVPCMFSLYDQASFDSSKASQSENVLDVMQRAGVNVLWLDNNSSSKGVADRVPYESYKGTDANPVCDIECRDEGMLANLQAYIDEHPEGDILIVLHQMGNHGPAYYKRYPAAFEKFTPTCQTNQLEDCSEEEINNSYDNAILYTDYFLSKTIELLKANQDNFEAALLYISDHGESLGEYGLFLHGLPYMLAPDSQTRVPMILWFGENFDTHEINRAKLQASVDRRYTHDNLFHTLLGLMEVETSIYDKSMDIIEHVDDGTAL